MQNRTAFLAGCRAAITVCVRSHMSSPEIILATKQSSLFARARSSNASRAASRAVRASAVAAIAAGDVPIRDNRSVSYWSLGALQAIRPDVFISSRMVNAARKSLDDLAKKQRSLSNVDEIWPIGYWLGKSAPKLLSQDYMNLRPNLAKDGPFWDFWSEWINGIRRLATGARPYRRAHP
jgi:hypothetical protein